MDLIERMKYELRQDAKKYGKVVVPKQDLELLLTLATENKDRLSLETASEIIKLYSEIKRLKDGITFIANEIQDDDLWDYLQNLLAGTEDKTQVFRFNKKKESK